ncbi:MULTISPECIES: class I SAM-dependent methyltransferase [unclassified Pseudoalteromonas]|uniref:class I SAM-dependent methyltransferase n=1 Tax=unclassified Pseudoalteromonas TaxID=194690 RepID=UPI001F32BD5D|nr:MULTISPECIES: class I SAM-dependent methyltransferase [unclassified Pseudoalteromonas]MCF2826893.1 class I SAM-dependent methyltransferase [Pseudoalteromonas sp. OF5H-5]MCF2830590.1 class I SAM-dependent methyltransferase [Pseudoalteromonas sp. DL2-H6]MCF2923978.1 class I SAM-dependent methyltransferase [Pseudoalteromonas sp. DL2-H1]
MSSTSRGYERHADDYYVTPHWLIHEFLDEFKKDGLWDFDSCVDILDPSAGGCEKYPMSYPTVLNNRGFNVETWDLREDSRAERKGINFLQLNTGLELNQYDMIITNPPFKLSQQFVYQALNMVRPGGLVVMLQRLNWLGSAKRKTMWQTLPLASVYVHSKRPGFNPEKPSKTDSIEYAHFVFCKGYPANAELLVI